MGQHASPVLDPQMAAILQAAAAKALPGYDTMSPVDARIAQEERAEVWNEEPLAVASVTDHEFKGAFGPRLLRVYDPQPQASAARPALLYLHGGGWVIGSPRSHDVVGRAIARVTGMPVLAYDYVKSPEHPFPEPIDDCVAAFRSLQAQAADFRFDPSRLGVFGDSAGAALSLNVAVAARDSDGPDAAAIGLIYPAVSQLMDTPSYKRFGANDDFLLSKPLMDWFWQLYVPNGSATGDPRIELTKLDLSGLAPTYLSVAELDPLRDEGRALLESLEASGNEVEYHHWTGVTHACLVMGRKLDRAHVFLRALGQFLKRRLDPQPV